MPEVAAAASTLGDLVARVAARLGAAGVPEPRREALRLAADLLGREPGAVALAATEPVGSAEVRRLLDAARRRAEGQPLAYVTGLAGFRRLLLRVDPRVLIPRPETEGLVDRVLQGARPEGVVVDVCTGSGCVALSLRQEGAFRVVVGTDRSPEALAVARDNRDRLELDVRLVRGDLATAFGESVADAVVANPPYVSAGEYEALDPAVRDHEPREALLSGPDGLAATRALLGQAERALRPRGLLALELATERAAAVAALATAGGWSDVRIEEDLTGRARYLVALRRER